MEETLLECLREIAAELHPHLREAVPPGLDSSLDRDLGFDSLARMELLSRLERRFSVSLSERVLAEAETPRDLLRAVREASGREASDAGEPDAAEEPVEVESLGTEEVGAPPVQTLVEAVQWYASREPERVHVLFYDENERLHRLRYGGLYTGARRVAGGLVERGLEPGEAVAIMLPTCLEYFEVFLGVQLAGAIPVPIYPPARVAQIEDHFRRHARILANARTVMLVTFPEVRRVARLLTSQVEGLRAVVTAQDLAGAEVLRQTPALRADDIAFLQYTSGSTGDPKGVVLTHANVLASLASMAEALEVRTGDVFASWLPLYHDMGLIGAWMGSLVYGFPLVLMSPLAFLARPVRWLRAIHEHRATLSGGPNFAYELCLTRTSDEDLEGLDLSSWRLAFNGAEPVSPATLRRFAERFAPYGLEPGALAPVYGLAEATLGVAFTPIGRGPRIDRIRRDGLAHDGRAEPAPETDPQALEVVSNGPAIPRFEVRIVDESSREVGDREQGRLQFRGPATTSGYYRNPAATAELLDGEWLDSGDLGYLADGEVYVTGRSKDVVIRAGRNFYPYELEQAAGEVEGVRRGCVAVLGVGDVAAGTERLVVVAETRETDEGRRASIRERIEVLAREILDMPADEVLLAPPRTVLKTSSGKVRRAAMRDLHEAGRLVSPAGRSVWLQVLRLALAGMGPGLRSYWRRLRAVGFATRAWVGLAVVVLPAYPILLALPGLARRWQVMRVALRIGFVLAGIPVRVENAPALEASGPSVLVSNHASYLDSLVLASVLPRPVAFVAKRELAGILALRVLLERLGTRLVERFDRERSAADARELARRASRGESLAYFPEGTLHRMPGLLPFQLGAFIAAAEADVPVRPVVLRGTRSILRGESRFPRPGTVHVEVLAERHPAEFRRSGASGWDVAVALRNAVREDMLVVCGEPDLAHRRALQELSENRGPEGGG